MLCWRIKCLEWLKWSKKLDQEKIKLKTRFTNFGGWWWNSSDDIRISNTIDNGKKWIERGLHWDNPNGLKCCCVSLCAISKGRNHKDSLTRAWKPSDCCNWGWKQWCEYDTPIKCWIWYLWKWRSCSSLSSWFCNQQVWEYEKIDIYPWKNLGL